MDKNKIIQQLNEIDNALSSIFTNGDNSIILVKCRFQLTSIINELSVETREIKINNEDKKE